MVAPLGKAYLVGAGPGDPRLLTLRAVQALGESELVLVDDLVHPEVLTHAKPGARVLSVGKRCGRASMPQDATTRLLVASVKRGAVVTRLKGGDPFVFGRGGEEAEALARAGLPFEIVPGVSSALGAAAHAGIPLTHRELASSVAFFTGHGAEDRPLAIRPDAADTLVFYMCQRSIGAIARELVAKGVPEGTPLALVRGATHEAQSVYLGTLREGMALPNDWFVGRGEDLPTLAIVGHVAALAPTLAWRGTAPLPLASLLAKAHCPRVSRSAAGAR